LHQAASNAASRFYYIVPADLAAAWRGCAGAMDFDVRDLDGTKRAFAVGRHASDFLHQFDCRVIALAKNGIAAIEAGVGNFSDKELRAVGVRSGVGVGETAGAIEGDVGEVSFLNL
jgi:hypothetical protein